MFILSAHWDSETDQTLILILRLPSSLTLVSLILKIDNSKLLEKSFDDE